MKDMKTMLVRLYSYINLKQQLIIVAVILLSTLTGMAIPLFIQVFIDDIIGKGKIGLLPLMGLALTIFTLLQSGIEFLQSFVIARIGEQTARRLRGEIYTQAARLDPITRIKYKTGNMISLFNNDVSQVYGFISSFVSGIVAQFLMLVVLTVALLLMNVKLTLLAVLTIPLYFLLFSFLGKRLQLLARIRQQNYAKLNTQMHEDVVGMSTFQLLRATSARIRSFDTLLGGMMKNNISLSLVMSSLSQVASLVAGLGNIVVLWAGTLMVMRQETTVGQLMAFSAYLGRLYGPILSIVSINQMFQTALPSLQRVFTFLDLESRMVDLPDARKLQTPIGNISLVGLSFGHDDGIYVLNDINLTIREGQFTGIVGESGSGKSTIASLLARALEPSEGQITFDGIDYRYYTIDSIRSRFGLSEQNTSLFTGTVRENITIGMEEISEEQVKSGLFQAFAEFAYNLPEKLDTVIDERGGNLSGGERQRLTLSRVLARRYEVLFLDEPTSNLDIVTGSEMISRIREEHVGKTLVIITHRLEDVRQADQIYVMQKGRLVGSGRHRELYAMNEYYRRLFDAQTEQVAATVSN